MPNHAAPTYLVKNPRRPVRTMRVSPSITASGTQVLVDHHTYLHHIVGYFDQPTNTATLPIISIYDSATTNVSGLSPVFTFQPMHEKNKEFGSVFSVDLGRILMAKGVTVEVGAYQESTGEMRVVHD